MHGSTVAVAPSVHMHASGIIRADDLLTAASFRFVDCELPLPRGPHANTLCSHVESAARFAVFPAALFLSVVCAASI